MTKKIDLPLILLAIVAFLAPLIGGQISTDGLGLTPGANLILTALTGGPETPTLSHAFLTSLCAIALIVMLLQRKIMQVPNSLMSGQLLILFAIICSSVGYSEFRGASLPAGIEWLTYGCAFYAVVAIAGRQRGPVVLLTSLFAGCVLLGLLGIREYGDMKAIDPTWRVFPQWVGPNAMAAVLVIGLFVGIGLAINSERLAALGISIGCIAIGTSLFLTQSKGAILALVVSVLIFLILLAIWVPKKDIRRSMGTLLGIIGCVALMAAAISFQPKGSAGQTGSPLGRITNVSASADQSMGFRKLLWQSAFKLIEQNPVGTGINGFQYESARPGLVTQTRLAHQTYLQLAAEVSPLAFALFIGSIGMWWFLILKAGSKLAPKQNVLRASVAASVSGVLIHSFIDSDLSYFGIGIVFFMLLGVGLLLSTDAVAPEFLPSILRRVAVVGVAACAVCLTFLGYVEGMRSEARGHLALAQYNDAQNILQSLRSMAPWDADTFGLSTLSTRSLDERLTYAKEAVALGPSTHNYRTLARVQLDAGKPSEAKDSLQRALQRDPNNMAALTLLAEVSSKSGFDDEAKKALVKLVDVEKSTYFTIRSLPEMVPTETYHARVLLARMETDPQTQIDLMQPAVLGYMEYLNKTVPNVIKFAKAPDGPMDFGGETVEKAKAKLKEAQEAAKLLKELYQRLGAVDRASTANSDEGLFGKGLDSLSFK